MCGFNGDTHNLQVCYDGDASRVVDLCRVRIVADSLFHVIAAVAAIARDGGVRVVRAKNSLRVARAPDFTAGFRVRTGLHVRTFVCVRSVRGIEKPECQETDRAEPRRAGRPTTYASLTSPASSVEILL
jgi:hypothetical protein